ncbi:digalactosyldiacylglycerol synthase 1, chloroplastic [Ricinus communis]|uniref:Digalactosyldiacylglycerol synthase 1, chloroplastic n=1 Tax=Ricinus communis TaxID=3988 RepID=B9T6N2_RICCO|nr:digalactosyldiacylglycerol synthase 1, chloroplastic [Ricinus communis]EEF28483.1 galactolipid galactosyltransferase, putative [Ricinus communis]|eukprot:XP_002533901.1 digalactosyldiacylglycerol synthase 1, chloroplastic [Ricinus communis]
MNGESSQPSTSAFSFISKGWREVRDSADADLQLMRARANSFKNLANSFDRELENFFNSSFPVGSFNSARTPTEIDFVKKLQPKISEFRRTYSAPEISKRVLQKLGPRAKLGIDLSAIRNAIVADVEVEDDDGEGKIGIVEFDRVRRRRRRSVRFSEFWGESSKVEGGQGQFGEWEPIRALKKRLRELEKKSESVEIFGSFKNNEFVEKLKSSLKAIREPQESKEVPPLDVPELLAYFVRQSEPFLDQLGVRKDICDKIVESLCSKRKNQLLLRTLSTGESSLFDSENVNDELDVRIASVLQSTGHCYEGGFWTDVSKHSLSDGKRHVAIVTTASLPWMTGTAVNPLFRAAYLAKSEKQKVTLLVPWLCKSDQELVYPSNLTFSSPQEQESYIRNWLEDRIGFKADFKISFYPGKFSKERRSIIPAGDTSQFIPSKDADIAILEEPEHLNWYHHGKRWTDKFNHVVGVVHTNYLEYIKREKNGALQSFLVKHINNWVTRAYCHKVLRLSGATQDLPKSVICNVHGVNPKFLKIGEKVTADRELGQQAFSKGAYFLGKMVWAKGYKELIDLLAKHKNELDGFKLDVFGNGEDAHEVQIAAKRLDLNVNFLKGRDHADDSLHGYKVFINPSVSDVLCTATAEALAMGKFVVCADHPSNEFFRSFPNCSTYRTSEDFVAKVREALENEPQPLTPEQRYNLSWEAATQRFMQYSDLDKVLNDDQGDAKLSRASGKSIVKSVSLPNMSGMVDGGLAFAHYCLTGNEFLRLCTGAIPGTRDYDKQHCKDLHLLPPHVENPIYGW